MPVVRVKLTFPHWPIERQTPGRSGVWDNCHFLCNTEVEECDYWVVCEGLQGRSEQTVCPRENTILITCEPPSIRSYKQEFLDQFATVITCHRNIRHRNVIFSHPALPWHIGRRQKNHLNLEFTKDYDELAAIKDFNKTKLISVVSSAKDDTEGHRRRLAFIEVLRQRFGDKIDIFGRGINEVEDKWDALFDYKYHIALENSSTVDYWTEKLSDPLLAGCHPIYSGCPNIEEYFSPQSMSVIDITRPDEAVQLIKECLENSAYEKSKKYILEEREKLLNRYNLFAMLSDHITRIEQVKGTEKQYVPVKIRKESSDSNVIYQFKTRILEFFVGR